MKVIDLLNKIANGEAPKSIKYEYLEYELLPERNNYYCNKEMRWFTNEINALGVLNDEVEIIEDKINKEIKWYFIEEQENEKTKIAQINMNFKILREKLTEIIDKLNKGE